MEFGRRGFWALAAVLLLPGVVCLAAPGAVRGWVAGGAPDEAGVLLHDHPEGTPAHAVARAYAQHAAQSRRFETALVFLIGLLYLGLASRWLAGRAAAEDRDRRAAAFAMHLQTLLDGIRRVESTTNPDALPPLLEMLAAARRRAETDWQRGRLTADDLTRLYAVYQASAWPAARRHNLLLHEELLARGEAPAPVPFVAPGEPVLAAPKPVQAPVAPPTPPVRAETPAKQQVSVAPAAAAPAAAPRIPVTLPGSNPKPAAPPPVSPLSPPRPVPERPVAVSTPPPVVQRPPMRAEHISEGIIGEPVIRSRRAECGEPVEEETAPVPARAADPCLQPEPELAAEAVSERKNAPPPRPAAQTAPRTKGKQRQRKKQEKARRATAGGTAGITANSEAKEPGPAPAPETGTREPGQMGFDFQ